MPLDNEEKALFRAAVAGARRLRCDRAELAPVRRRIPRHAAELPQAAHDPWPDALEPEPVGAGAELFFTRPGPRERQLRLLRQGRLAIDAELDLHGQTVAEARHALAGFLAACHAHDARVVRLISGKGNRTGEGRAVLKSHLNQWLRSDPRILAFATPPPRHGGSGALLVLLRAAQDR